MSYYREAQEMIDRIFGSVICLVCGSKEGIIDDLCPECRRLSGRENPNSVAPHPRHTHEPPTDQC